ncbi:MAG: RNA polymerase sigma factor [Armatimonadetes bacterium]|nr:RNA polymerase sigma factor [Armatimonadota bacterium]
MDGRIEQAKRGDRDALESLVREHYARVFSFCARRLGDDLAQDAAQETFVTMQRSLKRFEAKSSFETWLLGIAHNQCRNLARKKRSAPLPLEPWIEGSYVAAEDSAIDREALRCAMQKLSEEHREVVLLHEVEGLRYAEIAEILSVPEGTVKSRLFHAFSHLRRHLCDS